MAVLRFGFDHALPRRKTVVHAALRLYVNESGDSGAGGSAVMVASANGVRWEGGAGVYSDVATFNSSMYLTGTGTGVGSHVHSSVLAAAMGEGR